jgi:cell division protease FtsH
MAADTSKDKPHRPHPWKVEGAPPGTPGSPGTAPDGPKRPRSAWVRFGGLLIVLLVINWIVSSFLLAPPQRTNV